MAPLPQTPADVLRRSAFFSALSPESLDALAGQAELRDLAAGDAVFTEGDGHFALVVVAAGRLDAVEGKGGAGVVRTVGPGEAVDELQLLAGREGPLAVRAGEETSLLVVPGAAVDRLAGRYRDIREARDRLHRLQLLCRLSPVLGTFDDAFITEVEGMAEWVSLARGEYLDPAEGDQGGLYLVISGRVQVLRPDADGNHVLVGEAGRGETTDELTFFRDTPGGQRVRAVRDSTLVGFTAEEFERLVARRPTILRQVARLLTERRDRTAARGAAGRVTNVAVVATRMDAPLAELTGRIVRALTAFGPTLRLTGELVDRLADEAGLSAAEEDSPGESHLLAWLDAQESAHRFVVYQADLGDTPWTRRCIRMADRVIIAAPAAGDPEPDELERALFMAREAGTHEVLALIHPNGDTLPTGTRGWLAVRPHLEEHIHIRWDREGDIERLARLLAGRAVGLVLGGGGARGFAHIGIMRALAEAGVPVDAVGGTSMGAALAAQRAMEWDPDRIAAANRRVFIEIRPHRRFTVPVFSLVTNALAMECGKWLYGESDIEDLWLPFYCVSSNLATAEAYVHTRGPVWKATLASASLPAFAPPIIEGRHLLVDGGLLNNVPVDVMRTKGCGVVIASQVTMNEDASFAAERVPTVWEAFTGRVRRRPPLAFPSLLEVAVRSTMLQSTYAARQALADADFCLSPPIDRFGMMDFPLLNEIVQAGYDHGRDALAAWTERPGTTGAAAPAA